MVKRQVLCQDSLAWLEKNKDNNCIITSLPELFETKMSIKKYEEFFRNGANKCLSSTSDDGYCIFLQTDRKSHGWIDKSFWLNDEATKLGFHLVWKKISLNKDVGKKDLFRPTYSYMMCYTMKGKVGPLFPDVILSGDHTYKHGFGIEAVKLCIEYVKELGIKKVLDPFCGSGTTLAVANLYKLDAIGLDIMKKYCDMARTLTIE
jgi:DNA modification methylase